MDCIVRCLLPVFSHSDRFSYDYLILLLYIAITIYVKIS